MHRDAGSNFRLLDPLLDPIQSQRTPYSSRNSRLRGFLIQGALHQPYLTSPLIVDCENAFEVLQWWLAPTCEAETMSDCIFLAIECKRT